MAKKIFPDDNDRAAQQKVEPARAIGLLIMTVGILIFIVVSSTFITIAAFNMNRKAGITSIVTIAIILALWALPRWLKWKRVNRKH